MDDRERISSWFGIGKIAGRIIPLGNLLHFRHGAKFEVMSSGQYPVYGSDGGVQEIGYTDNVSFVQQNAHSIGISRAGKRCGTVFYRDGAFGATENVIVASARDGGNANLMPYLSYVLRSLRLNQKSTEGPVRFLTIQQLAGLQVFLPNDLQRCCHVAEQMQKYDQCIDVLQKQIILYNQMLQFKSQYFLQQNPRMVERCAIESIAHCYRTKALSHSWKPNWQDVVYRHMEIADCQWVYTWSEHAATEIKRDHCLFHKNRLLVPWINATDNATVWTSFDGVCVKDVGVLDVRQDIAPWLYCYLNGEVYKQRMKSELTGILPRLTWDGLKKHIFPFMRLHGKFCSLFEQTMALIANSVEQIHILEKMKNVLLSELRRISEVM